jgi:hypothetical protein
MESIGAKYGQWIIWSAASVSNADTASALDKFKSRAYGAWATGQLALHVTVMQ